MLQVETRDHLDIYRTALAGKESEISSWIAALNAERARHRSTLDWLRREQRTHQRDNERSEFRILVQLSILVFVILVEVSRLIWFR